MKLRVYIECPDCGNRTEVHVLGGWDISNVVHSCQRNPHMKHTVRAGPGARREVPSGQFGIEYDPPRRVF